MIGTDFVIASGYFSGYSNATVETYAYDTSDPDAVWRRMDDMPIELGVTHAATVVVGTKMYIAGGYLGGNSGRGGVGQEIADVVVYDHLVSPGNGQWSTLPSLPEGRSGGGMFYDSAANALVFGAGAVRPFEANRFAIDKQETWMYSFDNPEAGWVSKADIPFHANHMSYTTAIDFTGKEKHYFLAGQGKIVLTLLSCRYLCHLVPMYSTLLSSTASCYFAAQIQRVKMKTMAILAILMSMTFPVTVGPSEKTCPFLDLMLPPQLEHMAAVSSSFRELPMERREPVIFHTMIPRLIAGQRLAMSQ